MKHTAYSVAIAFALAAALQPTPTQAQLSRTAVSAASGNDANNCDVATPCRTFQVAHNKTNSDGEITVLDPGGYGSLTITKSISLVNDGVGEASILVAGDGVGITINAGAAAYVNLRGITIQGIGFGGGTGLRFNTGFALTIENCVIRNHTDRGIDFFPTGTSHLAVSNTLVADNGSNGINVRPTGSGTVKIVLNRVAAYNNSLSGISVTGTFSTGTINATVADSVAANNAMDGFRVQSTSAATKLMVVRSVAANNGTGIATSSANATLRIGQSTVTGNAASWFAGSGAVLRSYGDNKIDGNGDGDPAPITIAKK